MLVRGGTRVWLRAGSGGVLLNSCVGIGCVCMCVHNKAVEVSFQQCYAIGVDRAACNQVLL